MPIDVFVPPRISGGTLANPYFADWQPAVAGDDGKVWAWNHALQKYLPTAMSAGVTDHGALTGLGDDDHTQYHNDARGDLRYQPLDADLTAIAALATTAFGRARLVDVDAAALRSAAALGTAAVLNVGVAASNIVQLDGSAKLPAVDGSQLTNLPSGVTDHGALTGLANDDHAQYLLATGARTGASSQAQTFTNGVKIAKIIAIADGTNAGGFYKTNGTSQDLYHDSTNGRFGINTPLPQDRLHVVFGTGNNWAARFGSSDSGYIRIANNAVGAYDNGGNLAPFALNGTYITMSTTISERTGIGTTSPGYKLHVVNVSDCAIAIDAPAANYAMLRFQKDTSFKFGFIVPSGSNDLQVHDTGGAKVTFQSGGNVGFGTTSPTAVADFAASTTARASLRIRTGVAPTSPNDGDIWQDGTDIKIRINGVTKTFTLT